MSGRKQMRCCNVHRVLSHVMHPLGKNHFKREPKIHIPYDTRYCENVIVLFCLFACLLVCLFACLLVCLFACLLAFACLLVCLFACLFACLLVGLFFCLFVCLFVFLIALFVGLFVFVHPEPLDRHMLRYLAPFFCCFFF